MTDWGLRLEARLRSHRINYPYVVVETIVDYAPLANAVTYRRGNEVAWRPLAWSRGVPRALCAQKSPMMHGVL